VSPGSWLVVRPLPGACAQPNVGRGPVSRSPHPARSVSSHPAARWLFGLAAFALSVWALLSKRDEVLSGLGQIGVGRTVLSAPGMLIGITFGMLSWRTLMTSMGSRLPLVDAAPMYLLGQIGKYVPGSLWPVAAQMELGKQYDIPRGRSATSILLALAVSLTSGVTVVLCLLPLLNINTAHETIWLLTALPVLLATLYPPLLWRVLRRVPRLGPSLELGPTPRVRDIVKAIFFSVLGWLGYGLHIWVLASGFGPGYLGWKYLLLSVGAYTFAWVAGLLFFVVPAGAGARDLSLAFALSIVLPAHDGLAVAVLSRAVSVVADVAVAGLSAARIRHVRTGIRSGSSPNLNPESVDSVRTVG